MSDAVLGIGAGAPGNDEPLKPLAPNQRADLGLPRAASNIYKFTAEENDRFLHLIAACSQITSHYELFLLVQGELQFFLPHDILIAAWGEFGAQDPRFDVISSLPGVRTSRVSSYDIISLARRLHKIWDGGGCKPIGPNKSVAELLESRGYSCMQPCVFPNMGSTLVHGTCNRRDGYDSLYIALRQRPFSAHKAEARLRFLADAIIHQIDIAYRKVTALNNRDAAANVRPPSSPLSAREEEIYHWVYQGKTNDQIARILGISVNTVKNHVQRIFDKLGANNRIQAVARYRQMVVGAQSKPAGGGEKWSHVN